MKKLMYSILMVGLIVMLAACGSSNGKDGDKENGKDEAEASSGEAVEMKIAGYQPDDHPSTQALYKFAEEIEDKTDGRVNGKVYPANQLGDYITIYKEIMSGTIDMGLITTPSETDSRLDLLLTPYITTGYDNVAEVLNKDGYIFQSMQEFNNEQGVQMLGLHANGFAGVGTVKEVPNITNIDEDKNILLRTALGPIYSEPFKDLGFRGMTIPFSDLSSALQTGTVDGWAGGEASLNYFGFRDIIKYFYTTNDFFNADAFYINEDLWESFSEEDRAVIQEAADDLTATSFETAEQYDEEYRELLREEGIEVVELSDEDVAAMAEVVREKTWPKLEDAMGEDVIKGLIEEMDKY